MNAIDDRSALSFKCVAFHSCVHPRQYIVQRLVPLWENLRVVQQMAHCVTFIIITPASAMLTYMYLLCVWIGKHVQSMHCLWTRSSNQRLRTFLNYNFKIYTLINNKHGEKNTDILAEKSWHLPCRSSLFIDSERQCSFSLGISALRPAFVFYRHSSVFSMCPHFQSSCLASCKRLVFR